MDKQKMDMEALKELRKKIFLIGYRGGKMHLASCYSSLEIIYTLYCKEIMKIDKSNPKWKDRDRFILSKGHAGLALYCVLNYKGLLSDEILESYLMVESQIGGEPSMRDSQWIETSTGSLGHGLSVGVGMAIGLKADNSLSRVFVLIGDGECEEGSIWEAAMTASKYQLDNLTVILDNNRIQKMDFIKNIIGEPEWRKKWTAFGWDYEHANGHDISDLFNKLAKQNLNGVPKIIVADTIKGKGVSLMENNPNWHFRVPNCKELRIFKEQLEIHDEEIE